MSRAPRLQLDPAKLRALLDELARRLRARGVQGHIRIIGGAAMALRFPDDPSIRVTADVDAVYLPRPEVDEVIAELAQEHGLEVDWVNSRGASWLRVDPPSPDGEDFQIIVASAEQLIAMKLAAAREQDLHDLRVLARHIGIDDPQQLVDIAFQVYGEDSIELPDSRQSYLWLAEAVLAAR
ncbi:nucleotidyl transferase AbiEii/AbiGii toxin family protein [Leifsonia sp. RAF41]|uniref:nucleotidyl transferase AbiEii/AbiGii toxin family protein n=1 Tax=Leifsonia sp. RAF41 TaxID=3233056 RepID=UPI003F9BFD26